MRRPCLLRQFAPWMVVIELLFGSTIAQAAYPPREIFDLAVKRYSVKLDSDRSSCANYANPNTLQHFGEYQTLSVIQMVDRDSPGSLCNGVFAFKVVRVNCSTSDVSYSNTSIVRPGDQWSKNAAIAEKVCSIRPPFDAEVYDRSRKEYSLFLERTRACSFYANPKTLGITKEERRISVLNRQSDQGDGTICNGVFNFFDLTVRCKTGEVSYAEHLGSPATWKEEWQKNAKVAEQICKLPASAKKSLS